MSIVSGYFSAFDINVDAQGKNLLSAKINVTIKPNSINTGVEARDNHLKSADFFDVEQYPTITFKSSQRIKKGDVLLTKTSPFTHQNITFL